MLFRATFDLIFKSLRETDLTLLGLDKQKILLSFLKHGFIESYWKLLTLFENCCNFDK